MRLPLDAISEDTCMFSLRKVEDTMVTAQILNMLKHLEEQKCSRDNTMGMTKLYIPKKNLTKIGNKNILNINLLVSKGTLERHSGPFLQAISN